MRVTGMTSGSLASEAVGWVGTSWERSGEESPSPRYVNLFTTCVLYLAMVRAVKTPPCTHGARSSDQGHLTAGSGAITSPALRRPSPGPGVRLERTQQAGRGSHPRRRRRPELYGIPPVIEPPGGS